MPPLASPTWCTSSSPAAGRRIDARSTALGVVNRVLDGAYTAPTLSRALDPLEGVERSFSTDLVYGTLRWLIYLDAALAPRLREPDKLPVDVRTALRIGAYERLVRETPQYALVDAWVEIAKGSHPRLAGLVNAVLRRLEAPRQPDEAVRLALPHWLLEAFETSLGSAAHESAAAMLIPEPLWLVEHVPRGGSALVAEGASVEPGPLPGTLRARLSRPLADTRAFREGMVQPQNPSSTLPGRLLAPAPGERVLDLASGRGIKTAQLAAAGAHVVAVEGSRRRSQQAVSNLRRLGLSAEHVVADLTAEVGLEPARRVLLDAPCTGTGTLRGHPEIKLRITQGDVDELARLQRAMLDTAAGLTLDGGRLVYAVCSLTHREGEEQAAAFVSRHRDFAARPVRPPLPHRPTPHGAYVLPTDGLDGFFVSVLERGVAGGGPAV